MRSIGWGRVARVYSLEAATGGVPKSGAFHECRAATAANARPHVEQTSSLFSERGCAIESPGVYRRCQQRR